MEETMAVGLTATFGRSQIRNLGTGHNLADVFELCHCRPMAVFLDSSLNCSPQVESVGGLASLAASEAEESHNLAQPMRLKQTGRFSIVGIDPYLAIEEDNGVCVWKEFASDGTITARSASCFEDEVEHELEHIKCANPTRLPLLDGAIGYLSYDYGRKFENIDSKHARTTSAPDARMVFYDNLLIADHLTGELFAISHGKLADTRKSLDSLELLVCNAKHVAPPAKHTELARFSPNFEKSEYKEALAKMIDYIVQGDIYIANMTQRLDVSSSASPYDVYRYLRTHNPAPFSAYLNYPEMQVACASMERFLQVRSGMIETRPIKGTRPRGKNPSEDAAMRDELAQSAKDMSELLMIVDLERNDLNHVCVPSTVEVTDHFAIEEYATVFHLVSTIVGKLRHEAKAFDIVRSAFPGGSITGAPKIRAMQIIDELEHGRRGLYTGSIGYLSSDGSCDLNIVIRTAVHEYGLYSIGAGGGITCESDLEFEYEETLQKAKAVLEAIAQAEAGRHDGI